MVAAPAQGLLAYRVTVTSPKSAGETCAFVAIVLCRVCLVLALLYLALGLLSYLTSPWSVCVTFFGCECSCAVAMDAHEWDAFYHPGAPHVSVAMRTVRPHTVDHNHLCGVCPNNRPECVAKAVAQGAPVQSSYTFTNLSTSYTCYLPACASTVNAFYDGKDERRPDPDKDVCAVAPTKGAPCYTDVLNAPMCG